MLADLLIILECFPLDINTRAILFTKSRSLNRSFNIPSNFKILCQLRKVLVTIFVIGFIKFQEIYTDILFDIIVI